MCGICGLVALDGSKVDAARLPAMSRSLRHRGPDSDGSFTDGPVAIAARRLAIVDLPGGDQPVTNEDGRVRVVLNGEIYNHPELRTELGQRGHVFTTASDTEALVHLYEERGPAFVQELRGMFALALWDARLRRLVLARDPFGVKPLYYRSERGVLTFASELRALPAGEIDLRALQGFLALNRVPAPLSMHSGTKKLLPGHMLVWEGRGEPRVERFARPAPVPASQVRVGEEIELAEELRARLRDSVRAHLRADVPVGVLLSGGVDSGALAALAALESGERLSTFTVGFEEASFDELAEARKVSARYGTDHHELLLRSDAASVLPELAAAFDEPVGDSSALASYLVSKLASEHVKVVLSGEGGDELFGGYYTYFADLLAARIGPAAGLLRPLVDAFPASERRGSFAYGAKRFARFAHLPALERHCGWKEILSADARAELLRPGLRAAYDPLGFARARFAETAGSEELARLQDVDLGGYLVDDLLVKTDRASMAHSLEARVPYLDEAIVRFSLALPTHLKVRGWAKKRLLRHAVAPLLPRSVVSARKRGFSIPAAAWLRGPLLPFARDALSPENVRRQGFFEPPVVSKLLEAHVAGHDDLSRALWGLLMFTLWHEQASASTVAEAA
jgi:asparagine synthase (glutamine-hydrolysing)